MIEIAGMPASSVLVVQVAVPTLTSSSWQSAIGTPSAVMLTVPASGATVAGATGGDRCGEGDVVAVGE